MRSDLTVGDFTTDGAVVEAIGLHGVRLSSNDRMLPTSLRGYAPTVRGIAHSNARVTISQNGHIIRQLNVPCWCF
ncbi:fimbria/pilus outer membrane usher protein [Glaesserella parasuis]|uniref:fimbria/pilus outer membrane usher protein n=1 Tax=Glaesserella parasuis TaxID=738 RepID=UPI0024364BD7|nr:fimbria/pilus outer membrane usher protein [Glaesserella parasuis]